MHEKINYFLLIVLIWLQCSLWLGKNGILDYIDIYNSTKLYSNQYFFENLKARNSKLSSEIYNLLYSDEIIEEYARYDLNMIKSDEYFYQLKK